MPEINFIVGPISVDRSRCALCSLALPLPAAHHHADAVYLHKDTATIRKFVIRTEDIRRCCLTARQPKQIWADESHTWLRHKHNI